MKSWTKRNLICVMLTMVMVFSTLFGNFVYTRYCKAKDYTDAGSVQWVKDRAFSVLGITLPATGMNEFGLYGGNNYWNILKYEKGSEPEKNALAVWKYNDAGAESVEGKYGRVAFVEDVSDDIVTVTTGGCEGETFEENTGVIKRSVSKAEMQTLGGCSGFYGYIYLEKPIQLIYYSRIKTTFVSENNASLQGRIENPNHAIISQVGVWVWDSASELVVDYKEDCGLKTSYINQNLNIIGEAKEDGLISGETYTYQMYAVANGLIYKSGSDSFTTVDGQNSVITDVKAYDVTGDGYTVSCKVADDFIVDRVQFPTWTVAGEQDDIQENWVNNPAASGIKAGDIYIYKVKISEHNNEAGLYATHIYAYDKYGNSVCYSKLPGITVPEKEEIISTPVPTATVSASVEPSVTLEPTQTPAVSASPTPQPSASPPPTATPTLIHTISPVMTPAPAKTPTVTVKPTKTPAATATVPSPTPIMTGSPPVVSPMAIPINSTSAMPNGHVSSKPDKEPEPTSGNKTTPNPTDRTTPQPAHNASPSPANEPLYTISPTPTSATPQPTSVPGLSEKDKKALIVRINLIELTKYNQPEIVWKKTSVNIGYEIYRAMSKKITWKKIAAGETNSLCRYTDKKAKAGQKYYYKMRLFKKTGGQKYYGKYSNVCMIKTLLIVKPKIKGTTGIYRKMPYVQIELKKYSGIYAEIYIRGKDKKYQKIKLKSSSIKRYKAKFKLKCNNKKAVYYFKVRTIVKRVKKKYYSVYSDCLKVKVKGS